MRRLIILRHAKAASQGPVPGDRERPLAEQGVAQCARILAWLKQHEISPQTVLCSSSGRTRETWDRISACAPAADTRYIEALYLGSTDTYLDEVEAVPEGDVMLVGHNPTCAAIVAGLRGIDEAVNGRFDGAYSPGTVCVAERSGASWKAVLLAAPSAMPQPIDG